MLLMVLLLTLPTKLQRELMLGYQQCFNQSKSLLHAKIIWNNDKTRIDIPTEMLRQKLSFSFKAKCRSWNNFQFIRYTCMLHFKRFLSIENLVRYFKLFWRHIYISAPNTAWRYIDCSLRALQTLYWPLKFSGLKEHRFVIMTGIWRFVQH